MRFCGGCGGPLQSACPQCGYESPAGFKLLAETTDNPTVRAQAYLRGADLYLQRSRTPAATGEKPMTPEERRNGLDAARAMYRIVLDTAEHEMFKLNARFGLGAVAEDIGEWADARQQYETIIEQAGDAHPALREQAKGKLALLPRLPSPVRLASGNGESSTDGEEEEDIPMPFGLRDIGVDELLRPPPPPPGGEATDGKATDPKPAKSGTPGDTPATTNTPTKPESPANPPDPAKP